MNTHALRLVLTGLSLLTVCQAVYSAENPPNVIYIMADELGYYEPGFNGGMTIQTPNLDRMASEGMRFRNL
ncbi:MAG: sulfatase-like hydrolase/transferase, partial [Planctomycetaceae bacterium]|nr:sulfatase-like hydrolase/transferase [Planctomycetaceae bacterium]